MKKRIMSLILSLIMVAGLFPTAAAASAPGGITVYATVRIEANGFGTDGTDSGKGTVLPSTLVNLDELPEGYKAIDAVNEALQDRGLAAASVSGDVYTAFGGVSGESGKSWMFMLNGEAVDLGLLGSQAIASGDSIVLMLTGYDGPLATTGYAFFKTVGSSSDVQWGYPYGEVTLVLYSKKQNGVDSSHNPTWHVTPVPNIPIYSGGFPAYTPGGAEAVTDAENGMATITLWGGTSAGTYYFDISASVNGATSAYCRAQMVYDGTHAPTLSFSAPSAADTTLSALALTFPGAVPSNGLSYVGTNGITVGNTVQSVALSATARDGAAVLSATYKGAGDGEEASAYTLGESTPLAVGANTFKLTVTNGTDTQVHTLVIRREAPASRDIPNEAAAIVNGVKADTGDAPFTDWLLAMHAAGLSPTAEQLETSLAAVLVLADNFTDSGDGSPAAMAKMAIALTSLGIDARQIPDPDGGEAIDLVRAAAAAYDAGNDHDPVYSAPYLLSLYDLGNYEVPADAASTRLELINAILGSEDEWINELGFDGVGMVLPALAPYYNATTAVNGIEPAKCLEITQAVDRALASISAAQTIDGGLGAPNSNTVSTIITGLNAIGINANSDSRFIKGGTSLLMNLLSFRTADDRLGYNGAASANTLACLQGFQALAAWQNLSNTRSSNLYHFTREIAPYTNWPSARLLTGIAVTTLPATVTYELGTANTTPDTAGIAVTATYNGDVSNTKAIDIADCTVSAIDCSTAGTKTVTITYQGKTATFLVTVLGPGGVIPQQKTVSVTVKSGDGVIASNGSVVIEEGVTSVMDALKTVLNAAGKSYVIKNGVYVASIDGKGEFDRGANSGWLYSVNGVTPPTTAASDYILSDGDTVLWYYTLDYTTDPSSEQWITGTVKQQPFTQVTPGAVASNGVAVATVPASEMALAIAAANKNGSTAIVIVPEITGEARKVSVEMPKASLSSVASGTNAALTVQTPVGSVTIPNNALGSIAGQATGENVKVTLESVNTSSLTPAQQEAAGTGTVYDISILSGGNPISSFGGNSLTISLPYTLKEGEDPAGVTVWYLNYLGELEKMTCAYDRATGLATFNTDHLSYYVAGYETAPAAINTEWKSPFADVKAADWFYKNVEFAVQKGLFNGTSATAFSPNTPMTRAMLVTVLYRLEGSPAVTGASGFTDVKSGQWYTGPVVWANAKGIATGYGSGVFGTDDSVTREQLAVILYNYARLKGYDVAKSTGLEAYTDAGSISSWALDAMKWANTQSLITGRTTDTLAPGGNTTRAEVAAILQRFSESFEKQKIN